MICQACGVEAATRTVSFHQNIGALMMRFSKKAHGEMCKSCIHSTFWKFTLTTIVLGWWGIISLIVTPFFIVNNVINYVLSLGMQPVPPDAVQPQLTEDVVNRLQPLTSELVQQINSGDGFDRIAENIAMKAGVTKGQVALYTQALVASQNGS